MDGDEICIHEVCVFCNATGYPTDTGMAPVSCVEPAEVIEFTGEEVDKAMGLSEMQLGTLRLTEAVSLKDGPQGIGCQAGCE
jgi:hypothetical protein